MNMAMFQQIAQTRSHHQVHLQGKEIPILTEDAMTPSNRYRSHSWSNSWRSHSRSYHRCTHRSTLYHRNSSTYHHWWDTPHRRSSSHRSFSSHSRDHSTSRPHTSHKNTHITSSTPSYSSNRTAWKNKERRHKQVTIDDLPSEYYRSDQPSSESDKDLN